MICHKISTWQFTKLNLLFKIMIMDKSPEKIKEMFDKIAKIYDFNNSLMSFGQHKRIKKDSIKYLKTTGKVLDLCTGTGDVAGFLSKISQNEVIGLDFSKNMLEIAQKKYPLVQFIEGDCINLPFEANSFDAVTISFGLRNIENYDKALEEIYRVLKPNGTFMHLDFGKKNALGDLLFDFIVPKLVKIFYNDQLPYEYLVKSKKIFFNEEQLVELFKKHNLKVQENHYFLFGGASCQICTKI